MLTVWNMVIWFGLTHLVNSVAIVELNNSCRSDGICTCNSNITFTCMVQPYNGIMAWTVNGATVAECAPASCSSAGPTYDFDFDTSGGIFSMSWHAISLADNFTLVRCDAGGVINDEFITKVEVIPDDSDIEVGRVSGNSGIEIYAKVTKCIFNSESIGIVWKKSLTTDANDAVPYVELDPTTSVITSCTDIDNPNCGGSSTYKMSRTNLIQENSDGVQYYIFAVVTIKASTWIKRIDGSFLLTD